MSLPKTVKEIFDKYEKLSDWKSGQLESEIYSSREGQQKNWSYQNIKIWVSDNARQYPNIATIYVNCLYDRQNDCLPSELNDLRHLIKKD